MKKVFIRKQFGNFDSFDRIEAWYLNSFLERLMGLMFKKRIEIHQAGLFINKNENIIDSTIHMLFMNFDIAVFWINNSNVIVDKKIARKWGLLYSPTEKAQKILETHISLYEKINIGEKIIIENI